MDDWKQTVAGNLAALRKARQLTQAQLAEQLHYSDKAVSKWERGESLPDLAVMKQLADFYGILIDDLLLTPEEMEAISTIRKAINGVRPDDSVDKIIDMFAKTHSNKEFVQMIQKTRFY